MFQGDEDDEDADEEDDDEVRHPTPFPSALLCLSGVPWLYHSRGLFLAHPHRQIVTLNRPSFFATYYRRSSPA
jgi:hypothetical protein